MKRLFNISLVVTAVSLYTMASNRTNKHRTATHLNRQNAHSLPDVMKNCDDCPRIPTVPGPVMSASTLTNENAPLMTPNPKPDTAQTKPYLLFSLLTLLKHYVPSCTLCSSDNCLTMTTVICSSIHACFGSCSFAVAAPTIWNSLPLAIRSSVSSHSLQQKLKTFFYNPAFQPP